MAKQDVQTWEREFHSVAREQRVLFLYLANDVLQNSRRKGGEFVTEFWKVLSGSLRDVVEKMTADAMLLCMNRRASWTSCAQLQVLAGSLTHLTCCMDIDNV